ncbi:hypothetical protein M758_8G073900 [Ceratodon purpureus]|nr:hypothetical protein M758_8G073900 [Ceratodon purpureus]
MCNLEVLQVQHTSDEKELFETIMLLRKAQQALEAERLENCALRSHMNAAIPTISMAPQRDRLSQDQHGQHSNLFDHKSSAEEDFRKKWESLRKKPKRESHDLWTQILSDNASQSAFLDQDYKRNQGDYFSTSTISKPFSSDFGYQLLELRDDGIKSVTKTESLIETVVNGSIEEYYMGSWDQEKYYEHRYEDAIPSWRKTYLPDVARPSSWNNGYEESAIDVQSVVTNRQCDWRKVDMGVGGSSRDPGSAWNRGQYGDLSHTDRMQWDMAYFEGEEKIGVKLEEESLNSFRDFETTTQIRNAGILGINCPAASIRNLKDSDTSVERKAYLRSEVSEEKKSFVDRYTEPSSTMKGARTRRIQRDTQTMETNCQGRLANSSDNHEHENLDLNRGKPFLKEVSSGTSNDEGEQSYTSAYRFTTSTNVQTSMDISSVEDYNSRIDSRNSWDSEKHKTDNQMSLELTQDIASGTLLTVHDIPDVRHTENNNHVEKQAGSPQKTYSREPEEITRDSSEAEENLIQDPPSSKCILSLKYDLKSSEESAQNKHESDSHSKGDQHETADSATDVPKNPTMIPEIDNRQPLNSAQIVESRSCEYMKCKERIKDNQNYSQSETESEEDKVRHAIQGDETRHGDTTDEALEYLKLTNNVNQEALDVTSLAPSMKQSEGTPSKCSPTISISDSDTAQDPDKDLNRLMRSLGLTVDTNDEEKKCLHKKDEELLSEKGLSPSQLNSQKEESRELVHENCTPGKGNMSGLPEIGGMLFKGEMHQQGKAQNNLQVDLLQGSTEEAQVPPERANVEGNADINLSSQATRLPALETLRTSIVIRKQEMMIDKEIDKETGKESPRLMDSTSSHKNHPILALAIRNNQLVKLETQDELPKEGKTTSFLNEAPVETVTNSKVHNAETSFSKETSPRLVDESSNVQHASQPIHTPASQEETHSSSEESIYGGDSFEEEEEGDVDQKRTCSEESCISEDMRVSSGQTQGSLGIETIEQSSPSGKANAEGSQSRSPRRPTENWEGESEQGSYSLDEDDIEADSIHSLDTCGSQGTTDADRDHSVS